MSKDKVLLFGGLGVFSLGAIVLGYFFYSAYSDHTEAEEKLEEHTSQYRRYYSAQVFPSKKSIEDAKRNAGMYDQWLESAAYLASRGDKVAVQETPPLFKQRLQDTVRSLAQLPGHRDGKISLPTFLFGFEQFLGDNGQMPASGDVAKLAAQLDAIAHLTELLSDAGVSEIVEVRRLEKKVEEAEEQSSSSRRRRNNKAKKQSEDESKETKFEFSLSYLARPDAFANALNAITADMRFFTITDISFSETEGNLIDAAFRAKDDENNPHSGRSRRGRRSTQVVEEPVKKEAPSVITDPELEPPLRVTLTIALTDFGKAVAEKPAEEKPAEAASEKPVAKSAEAKGDK